MSLAVTELKTIHETRDWAKYLKIVCDNGAYPRGGYALATPIGTPIIMEIVSVTKGYDAAWDDTNNKMLVYRHKRAPFILTNGVEYNASAASASLFVVPIEMSASIYEFGFVYTSTSSTTVGSTGNPAGKFRLRTISTAGVKASKATITVVKDKTTGTKTTSTFTAFTVKPGWLLQFRHTTPGNGGKKARGVLYVKGRPTPSGCEALASATLSSVVVLARAVFQQI